MAGSCTAIRGEADTDTCQGSQLCDSAGVCDKVEGSALQRSGVWRTFGGTRRVAQSFSLTRAGSLMEIHVALRCDIEQMVPAELQRMVSKSDGTKQPSDVVFRKLRDAGVAPQSRMQMFVVEGGVALNAGEEVAIVFGTTQGTCSVNDASASYAGGSLFSQDSEAQGWLSGSGGAIVFRILAR